MNELLRNIGLMSLASLIAGAACGGVAMAVIGVPGVMAGVAAALLSLPVGVAVLCVFYLRGVSPGVIVLGTLLRAGLSLGGAGLLAALFESLRTPTFFLAVAVIYLANLFVETWLVFCEHQRSEASPVKVVRPWAGG